MSLLAKLFKRKPAAEASGLFADVAAGGSQGGKPEKPAKQRKAKKVSGQDAGQALIIASESGEINAAFGMRWRTLIKAGGREDAQQMAYKAKATHYILKTHLLGYGIIPKGVSGTVCPAALLAAKSATGTSVFAFALVQPGQYWITLIRNAVPTNLDEVLTNVSEAEVVARVKDQLAQFEGETVTVFTDIRNAGFDSTRNFSLRELFDIADTTEPERMTRLPPKGGTIPKPIMWSVILGAVALAGQKGYSEYRAHQARLDREANQVVEESPDVAWKPVVAEFAAKTAAPNGSDYLIPRKLVDEQPVLWLGWVLATEKCVAGDLQKDTRIWTCTANYDRTRVGSTSEQMKTAIAARFPDAVVVFPSISQLSITRTAKEIAQPIVIADLVAPETWQLPMTSKLQTVLPTLAQAPTFKVVQQEFKPPLRKDGKPHPRPASVPNVMRGELAVKGPIRSIDATSAQITNISWDTLAITFTYRTDPSQKSITNSSVMAELSGKAYGKK